MERERLQDFSGNGSKVAGTFSAGEMQRRLTAIRSYMAQARIDAALFTSYHNINYYADFMYCQFGRRYGLLVDHEHATSISAGIDGGQPWRRTFGRNLTYTDWQKDNYFHAIAQVIGAARRVGIEFDQVSVDLLNLLQDAFPSVVFVDIAAPAMRLRMIKSAEEIAHITEMARIADIGGAACVEATGTGVPEHEVALHSTATMVREIARSWPEAELMDTWTWFQSGINTDGAHNPVTSRRIQRGDILSLNCFPMVAGYYVALERTLFAEEASDAHLRLWEFNCRVHDRGKQLLVPGARCSDIAAELNDMYAAEGLLRYRSFGYGHSFGVLSHYYGREAGLELREDCETVLEPGMVISMEPMITIPEGQPGAGGYREHDILVIGEAGSHNITRFPYGPDHLIVGAASRAA
ncbi:creatininase [Haematobacter missouriensis]|uniref:Creatininase n=1 Tax=Haematobacter missouriensis TaxID=366616 RepID=A0A212AQ56_9RHOB|nr:aminopeptidase P family protein [Haematobacter missouriensis]KFI30234.1 creatininase [Haematobacter missouriensis]OWJ70635.1 creatininase [Haematobacter missouriensis]OWJ83603.1 creatininase [Haematobacter missouriensis]